MLSPLTVPQRSRPLVLPPVPGFQGGFKSTMEVDNPAVRQRDGIVILRFTVKEGALVRGHNPWSTALLLTQPRRAAVLILLCADTAVAPGVTSLRDRDAAVRHGRRRRKGWLSDVLPLRLQDRLSIWAICAAPSCPLSTYK